MGMSIDEALNYMPCLMEACSHCLVRGCDKPIEKIEEVKIVAIDIIRKYQKIEQILDDCDLEAWEVLEKIKEVIKDGEID